MDLSQKLFPFGLMKTPKRGEEKGEQEVQPLGVSLG